MPDAMPQIHQLGDKQIMLFLRDVDEHTIGNHTQLVYSVCEDGVWSEPQSVWESDTADFFFSTAVENDQLVVAWQKSSEVATAENAEDLLAEIAENSEICFAEWDARTETFTNQKYVTDNDLVDMMPAVAIDGKNIVISWVCNDANNMLGTEGNYQIYQVSVRGNAVGGAEMLYSTTDYVVELAASMTRSGSHMIFSTVNENGTVDLYSLSGKKVEKLVSSENPAGLSFADGMFMWQNDGSIYSLVPGSQEAEILINADTASVSSSYEYATNGTADAVIWSNMTELGYEINASVRTGATWSAPIALLSGEDDTVSFMDAVMLDNGNYSVILNTVSYTDEQDVGETALQYANVTPKTDISVELSETEQPDWENGTQEINIALENSGVVPVYSTNLTITCEDGTLLSETLALELLPGESQLVTKTLDIQTVNREMEGIVAIQTENDIDASNNMMSFSLGQVDTSLDLDVYENGDQFLFVLTAANRSNTDANAALSIIEDSLDGVVLNMKNIGIINNTENVQYLFSIDRSKVDFAGKETKTYFFSLSTLENDWNDSDNVCTYMIKAPNNVQPDPDGEMDIINIVQPERVEIVEKSLHFSSLDDESVQLHAVVYPEDASVTAVYWSAENNDIVHITEDGIVTPLREGTTTITAMVTDDIKDTVVVTVVVEAETHVHTIIFDANGGRLDQGSAETKEDGTLNSLPEPVRDGYDFLGWFTEISGGDQVTTDTMFTNDATVYAHWEETDNREETEPVDPTDPSIPEEPVDPSEPTDSEESDDSTDPDPSEPEDSVDPTDPEEDNSATSPDSDNPQTGDGSNISLYIAIMIISIKRKPREQNMEKLCQRLLTEYFQLLKSYKQAFTPKGTLEIVDERYLEACRNIDNIEYLLDCMDQGDLRVRFMAFGNGTMQALHDRSFGFFRRQIILTVKERDPGRKDDPCLAEKLCSEIEGIFLWAMEGLRRLIRNDYQFTLSANAMENMEDAVTDGNNIVDFLKSEGYFRFKSDYEVSSRAFYDVYRLWCEDNATNCLSQKTFCSYLKQHADLYNLEYTNKVHIGGGRFARGFLGIELLQKPGW